MIKVNFNLRLQDSKDPENIYMVLRWDGNRYRYPTKWKVKPLHWNKKAQKVNAIDEVMKNDINRNLQELKITAQRIYTAAVADNLPITAALLKERLDLHTGRKVVETVTFWSFVNKFIETAPTRILPDTGKKVSRRTIQRYNTARNILQEYEKESGNKLTFDHLDLDMLTDFKQWLTSGKEYAANTVAKYIETLKTFLNAAASEKITVNLDYKSRSFKAKREDADSVYLDEAELAKIAALQLSDQPRLDRVRDLFMIGAYTGLRFSDFMQLQPHHFKNGFIDLTQTKTNNPVTIPIHPKVKEIFDKYKDTRPPKISNQKFNDYIKDVCKEAKITELVEITQTKGGATVKTVAEKYKLVSSHTGRRSCATNLYKKGLPIQTIMAITGHKTEKAFRIYIRLSKLEHAEMISKVWDNEEIKQTA
ncbi:site-specific integrase [Puia dinghuensis]|uniref:Integrase n=1 Tax=Puia dinghuensis TaxID=1792502 RepID=A0A8J2UDL8_9BACT|nr:site-specific integrase [Puia dinghuensis]GGB01849.1 integrase [Puia dinghuensis]